MRLKRGGPFMHLKAYAIDGVLLHTGSANYDLIVIRDASAAAKFVAHFERTANLCARAFLRGS